MKGLFFATLVASTIKSTLAASVEPAEEKRAPAATSYATAVTLSGNPSTPRTLYPNLAYSSEVLTAAASMTDRALAAKATAVSKVGTFLWI